MIIMIVDIIFLIIIKRLYSKFRNSSLVLTRSICFLFTSKLIKFIILHIFLSSLIAEGKLWYPI